MFYVTDVVRDEDTNDLTVTAYDALYKTADTPIAKINNFPASNYTTLQAIAACAVPFGGRWSTKGIPAGDSSLTLTYPNGGNFDGTETLRDILKYLAEVTTSICYLRAGETADLLTFQRLDKERNPVIDITQQDYWTLKTEAARKLGRIIHTTELGDNTASSTLDLDGEVQYIRSNPFLEAIQNEEGGSETLYNFLNDTFINGINIVRIVPFYCEWYGNCLLEPGDKIRIAVEGNKTLTTYVLNQTITFDGTYEEILSWKYEAKDDETPEAPVTLTEVLNQTYAKVDKVDKEITLAVSEMNEQGGRLTKLELDTEGLTATVSSIETTMQDSVEGINESLETLTRTVETKMTSEEVTIAIKQELENGVDKVTTSTGFTFDEEGLTVSKSNSEMSTQITEDGMRIYRNDEEMLTADHTGVNATNLHATTYLMVGGRSRFENYQSDRTGCFWIGGND